MWMNIRFLVFWGCLLMSSFSDGKPLGPSYCEESSGFKVCAPNGRLNEVTITVKNPTNKLRINNPYIGKIDENAFKNLNITELTLVISDKLEVIPESFNGLPMLKDLSIHNYYKPLTVHKKLFRAVPTLLSLRLSIDGNENELGHILSGLSKLKFVEVRFLALQQIDKFTFADIESPITDLEISGKLIEYIEPLSFKSLKNLVSLSISNTKLSYLKPGTFDGLKKLERLHFFENMIETIERGEFTALKNLKELSLSHTNLKELQPYAFFDLQRLTNLDLSLNKIEKIGENAFYGLRLQYLDLGYNYITEITDETFSELSVKELSIRGNEGIQIYTSALENSNVTKIQYSDVSINIDKDTFKGVNTIRKFESKRKNKIDVNRKSNTNSVKVSNYESRREENFSEATLQSSSDNIIIDNTTSETTERSKIKTVYRKISAFFKNRFVSD